MGTYGRVLTNEVAEVLEAGDGVEALSLLRNQKSIRVCRYLNAAFKQIIYIMQLDSGRNSKHAVIADDRVFFRGYSKEV